MKPTTLAPWAEPIPNPPPNLTANDLLDLPDDGYTYELVEGRLVRVPGSGLEATVIAANLHTALNIFVRPRKLGLVTGSDGEFDLTQPGEAQETALVPDVAFLRVDRVPPRDSVDYKKAPRLVWVVWPADQQVDVWRPGADAPATTLAIGDQLDGLDVLPGFAHPVADLFQ